jgi:hypothetical protein
MLIYDWYFKQAVTEEQMNDAFGAVQSSMQLLMSDQNLIGIAQGGTVTQDTPSADLTVVVGGPLYAYDQLGQRIFTTGTGNNPGLDCSQDSSHVTTAVAGAGNEKWISIFILFERVLSDPVIDGNGATVFYVNSESFEYQVLQGAEAPIGTAVRVGLINPGLLVADLHRAFGQTTFQNSDILQTGTKFGQTGRFQVTFDITGSPFSLSAGTLGQAITAMLAQLNTISAATLTNGASPGTRFSLSSGSVSSQLDALQGGIDTIMTVGADTVKTVVNLTALRAITAPNRLANSVVNVNLSTPNNQQYALYFWNSGDNSTDDGLTVILPADTPAFGRWNISYRGALEIPGGLPQLDSFGKVKLLDTHWAIVSAFYDPTAGGGAWQFSGVPGDTAFHVAPGGPMTTIAGLLTTDKIAVEMMFDYAFSTAGTFFTINFTQNGSPVVPQWTSDVRAAPLAQTNGYVRAIFSAVAGSNAIHYGYNAGNASQNLLINPLDGHVVVYRP